MSTQDALSALLGLLLMGDGLHNDSWGDLSNANLQTIENAIAGVGQIDGGDGGLTGGSITLTAAQTLPRTLVFVGALTSPQTIIVPATTKNWLLDNQTSGNFPLTVTTANGTGITVNQGQVVEAYCDGTNVRALTVLGSPIGEVTEYYGIELPDARYIWANGQVLSRESYGPLFNVLSRTTTATYGAGVTLIPLTENLGGRALYGSPIEGPGIPTGATVVSFTSNSVTISAATTGSATQATLRFIPYGNGDGSTTFNAPDRRECMAVGSSAMGGLASPGRITQASMPLFANLGQRAGEDRHTLTVPETPSHNHTLTDPGHAHAVTDPGHNHQYTRNNINNVSLSVGGAGSNGTIGDYTNTTQSATTGVTVNSAVTGITLAATGGGGSHNNLPPLIVCNYIMRVA